MPRHRYRFTKSFNFLIPHKKTIFLVYALSLLHLLSGYKYSYADNSSSDSYQLIYEKNLISISAKKASLKNILTEIEEKADISIRYPSSLDKKITLKITEIPLRKALERLLKDFNYSIIYSGSKKQAVISDVYILQKDQKPATTGSTNLSSIANRIRTYERRIETLKNNLSKIDENSARGKRYLRQIESYEKTIARLRSQSN